ncbi:MAG: hypothetical protein JXA93_05115 [Anaerolineae bacterium]|nr:hypothetical protein [Anaerolineae bacterium]
MEDTHAEPAHDIPQGRRAPALLASGLAGLAGAALLAAGAAWLVASGRVRPPFEYPMFALVFALVFGGFSLAEVPLMVFALRRLLVERVGNRRAVTGLNSVYVLFAAVYALPVFFFTGNLAWGWLLSTLALLRLASSLIFVRVPRP